jgi:hypothetical protein
LESLLFSIFKYFQLRLLNQSGRREKRRSEGKFPIRLNGQRNFSLVTAVFPVNALLVADVESMVAIDTGVVYDRNKRRPLVAGVSSSSRRAREETL